MSASSTIFFAAVLRACWCGGGPISRATWISGRVDVGSISPLVDALGADMARWDADQITSTAPDWHLGCLRADEFAHERVGSPRELTQVAKVLGARGA
jgi:hypothetical protein